MSHFDDAANSWDTPEKIKFFEDLCDYIHTKIRIPSHGRVLDFGCGTGLFGLNFLNETTELVGIDPSAQMLKVMREKVKSDRFKLKTFQIDLEKDETNDSKAELGKFNLIVSAMAFHHLENPKDMLTKLSTYLKSESFMVIVDLDKEDGTFHPDNKAMGVKHFGFSKDELSQWAKTNYLEFEHYIYRMIPKNNREYAQFICFFKN